MMDIILIAIAFILYIGIVSVTVGRNHRVDWLLNIFRKSLYYRLNKICPGWEFTLLEIMYDQGFDLSEHDYIVELCLGDTTFKKKPSTKKQLEKDIEVVIKTIECMVNTDYTNWKKDRIKMSFMENLNSLLRFVHNDLSRIK